MFEILFEYGDKMFCEDMIDGGYYIYYKQGGKRKEDALYYGCDYNAALVAWEKFKTGKYD